MYLKYTEMIKISIFDAIIFYLSSFKDEKKELPKAAWIHYSSDTVFETAHKRPGFFFHDHNLSPFLLISYIHV